MGGAMLAAGGEYVGAKGRATSARPSGARLTSGRKLETLEGAAVEGTAGRDTGVSLSLRVQEGRGCGREAKGVPTGRLIVEDPGATCLGAALSRLIVIEPDGTA